ncbi:MAG: hypothetical protein WAK01_16255 [Methylocystis sp.]
MALVEVRAILSTTQASALQRVLDRHFEAIQYVEKTGAPNLAQEIEREKEAIAQFSEALDLAMHCVVMH